MTATFEVRESVHVKDVPGRNGPVPIRKLALWADGQVREAELFDAQGLNPQVGQKVMGTIEEGQYGLKFKPQRPAGQGGGGPRGRSPEDRALDALKNRSIMAESCVKSAVEYAGVMQGAGRLPDEFTAASVVQVAEVFWRFIDAKTKGAGNA